MKNVIYYGIGLGLAFLAGYLLSERLTQKRLDEEYNKSIEEALEKGKKAREEQEENKFVNVPENSDHIKIRSITEWEYNDPYYNEFSKESLTYYQADDTLCDDDYNAIDQDETVGSAHLDPFRQPIDDCPTYLYVRNMELCTDYEIVVDSGSYHEDVLGFKGPVKMEGDDDD